MDDLIGNLFGGFGLLLLLLVVGFLLGREWLCWYWKVNERLALLKQIRDLLQNQAPAVEPARRSVSASTTTVANEIGV